MAWMTTIMALCGSGAIKTQLITYKSNTCSTPGYDCNFSVEAYHSESEEKSKEKQQKVLVSSDNRFLSDVTNCKTVSSSQSDDVTSFLQF